MENRRKTDTLHSKLSRPDFALFLLFLQPQLELLAKINKQLQNSGQTMYIPYGKINAFFRCFVAEERERQPFCKFVHRKLTQN